MADDAARITPGPEHNAGEAGVREHGAGAEEVTPVGASVQSAPAAETEHLELLGRSMTPASPEVRQHEPAAVLVGAGSGQRTAETGRTSEVVDPSRGRNLGQRGDTLAGQGMDAPVWSFRDAVGARGASAPPLIDRRQAELPFARSPELVAASPARSQPTFGPVGRTRAALLVPLLAVITLGGYAIAWHHRFNRELEEFDPKLHARPARSTVAVAVPWAVGLLATLAGAGLILGTRYGAHIPFDLHVTTLQSFLLLAGLAVVPYLVLLLPFSLVAVVMSLERLRAVEEHIGVTTDRQVRPVGTTLLLAIPIVGGLALLVAEQRRLNAIWEAVTPSGNLPS